MLQLALALHPDKNGAPGADEAFKSAFTLMKSLDAMLTTLSGVKSFPGSL